VTSRRSAAWSVQDLRDAFAEVSDDPGRSTTRCPDVSEVHGTRPVHDPSEDFLTNAEEILYLLGAPNGVTYAEDEVLLPHDYGSQGSHVMYLRGTPRLDAWSESQVGTSCRQMHICDRWTFQERCRRTLVAHGDDGLEQRKICTSVIDAVDGCCLSAESYVNPGVQDTVRRCLSDIETIGMLDRKCTLRVFNHTR
jgi:hypothetical protein